MGWTLVAARTASSAMASLTLSGSLPACLPRFAPLASTPGPHGRAARSPEPWVAGGRIDCPVRFRRRRLPSRPRPAARSSACSWCPAAPAPDPGVDCSLGLREVPTESRLGRLPFLGLLGALGRAALRCSRFDLPLRRPLYFVIGPTTAHFKWNTQPKSTHHRPDSAIMA